MKYIFILLAAITFTGARAQLDSGTGGIAIPRSKTTVPKAAPTMSAASPFSRNKEKAPTNSTAPKIGEKEKNFSMFQKNDFVSRSSEYQDRVEIRERGESNEAYKGNKYFGEVRTKSKFVQVLARDFEYADGDRIKVLVNDRVVVAEIILDNSFRGIQITLDQGFNKIDFEALNQGTSGPNTAEFRVFDDKEQVISSDQWNLATGFKATVMVVKE
ncbi:hypothetical protein HYN59_14355 [Flavobacterium album]|uniref:Secreted protein n=1 Tax=Flavobacterium album TaxID=2175091 RepID=A0A2S1R0N3_9FLAO|nr:hypothetical protein [Flavobacterium album]AWH86218.1 hypothetical protein HYN59_14355 [Flavobacterium album]